MKPFEPAELSAYLDGELDAARAKEIEVLLANDPGLRAEFDQLKRQDAVWISAVHSAVVRPRLSLEPRSNASMAVARSAVLLAGLLAVRFVPKFPELVSFGVVLHIVVLAVALAWVVRTEG